MDPHPRARIDIRANPRPSERVFAAAVHRHRHTPKPVRFHDGLRINRHESHQRHSHSNVLQHRFHSFYDPNTYVDKPNDISYTLSGKYRHEAILITTICLPKLSAKQGLHRMKRVFMRRFWSMASHLSAQSQQTPASIAEMCTIRLAVLQKKALFLKLLGETRDATKPCLRKNYWRLWKKKKKQ